jgi:hypothetical protein
MEAAGLLHAHCYSILDVVLNVAGRYARAGDLTRGISLVMPRSLLLTAAGGVVAAAKTSCAFATHTAVCSRPDGAERGATPAPIGPSVPRWARCSRAPDASAFPVAITVRLSTGSFGWGAASAENERVTRPPSGGARGRTHTCSLRAGVTILSGCLIPSTCASRRLRATSDGSNR